MHKSSIPENLNTSVGVLDLQTEDGEDENVTLSCL